MNIKKIKEIIESIAPEVLDLKEIRVKSFKKLGVGEGNINYVFVLGGKKFICRINLEVSVPEKSEREYNFLKTIENLKIAPKVYFLHKKNGIFGSDFIILDFIEGDVWRSRKRTYTDTQIKRLARAMGNLHKTKIASLKKEEYEYSDYLIGIKKHIEDIVGYAGKKYLKDLMKIHDTVRAQIPKEEKHRFSLIHDDLCPQNIVEHKEGVEIIDWESGKFSDPAKDVSHILTDFELKGKDLDLFLAEYLKLNRDKDILERVRVYDLLNRLVYFVWEIVRSFEIINKELPKEYLAKTTAESHINEAKFQFRKLRELVDVGELDVDCFFEGVKVK
jgi:thiamine kinase-like enzyme